MCSTHVHVPFLVGLCADFAVVGSDAADVPFAVPQHAFAFFLHVHRERGICLRVGLTAEPPRQPTSMNDVKRENMTFISLW